MNVPEKPLTYLERLRRDGERKGIKNYADRKKIRVYFIRSIDETCNERVYFYAAARRCTARRDDAFVERRRKDSGFRGHRGKRVWGSHTGR